MKRFSRHLLFGLVFIAASPLHAGITQPLARVARVAMAPAIDGALDDPCWKNTIAIADFETFGNHSPAAETTEVRFGYDRANLYLAVRCDESLLDLAAQKTHEVRTRAKERDGDVFGDDSVLFILHPPGGDACFEFCVNSLGVLSDARTKASQLWSARDLKWNSTAKVAATVSDGRWCFEMAIPWSDLSGKPPEEGSSWEVVLARVARGREEFTSWNSTSPGGVHAPEGFGKLLFGGYSEGVRPVAPLSKLQPGKNPFEIDLQPLAGKPSSLTLAWQLSDTTGKEIPASSRKKVELGDQPKRETGEIEARGEGLKQFGWSLRETGTLLPLYISPTVNLNVAETDATLQFSTAAAYRIFVNGEAVARGSGADRKTVRLPLRQGANAIAVEAASGVASLALDSTEKTVWLMAPASAPDATSAKCNESRWVAAPEAGADAKGRPQIGKTGESAVFRHTLLLNQTRVWPAQNPALHLVAGTPQFITFTAQGIPGKDLSHWQIDLRVPAFLEVRHVSGFYGNTTPGKAKYSLEKRPAPASDGGAVNLYRITADQPVAFRPNAHPLMRIFQISVQTAELPVPPASDRYFMQISSTANDGAVTEKPRKIPLSFLPKLAGRQPSKLIWQFWGGGFGALDDEGFRKDLLLTSKAAGFNELVAGDRWTTREAKPFGIKNHTNLYFKPGRVELGSYLKEHPEARLIDAAGKPSDFLMCTSRLLGEDWPQAAAAVKKFIQIGEPDVVSYDYEYPPLAGPHSCYCERCLAQFRAFAEIPAGTALTPETIRKEHVAKWVDFMAKRTARLFRLMKDAVKETSETRQFSVYSGYQTERNPAQYGVNWQYVAEQDGADVVACGYGRPMGDVEKTVATFKGKPVVMGELLVPYLTNANLDKGTPLLPTSRAKMLRLSLDASGGVLVYDRNSMDGRSWQAVAETTRLVADYEPLFLSHRLESIPKTDPASVQLLRGNGEALLCIMNGTSRARDYAFSLPQALGGGKEYYTGKPVEAGADIHTTLPPGEVAVYLFSASK